MKNSEIESIYRIIKAINTHEVKQLNAKQKTKKNRFLFRLYFEIIVFPFCLAVILGLSKKYFGAPEWVTAPGLLALLLSYIGIIVHPIVSAAMNKNELCKSIKKPFSTMLDNSKKSTLVDNKFIKYLENKNIESLQLVYSKVSLEKKEFEKRVSLVIGAIEKIGILPGILASVITVAKFDDKTPGWIYSIAYATPILYLFGAFAHVIISKLERMALVLEFVIDRKNALIN